MTAICLYFNFMVFGMALFEKRFYPWISCQTNLSCSTLCYLWCCRTKFEKQLLDTHSSNHISLDGIFLNFHSDIVLIALIFNKSSVICLVQSQKSLFLTLFMLFFGILLINDLANREHTLLRLQHKPHKSYWPRGWGLPEAI